MLEHRTLIALCIATFALLSIGGVVNPTESSLACPEATIICHGQFFPAMEGGVLYEHGHRLFAMTVGLLQILVTILLWRRRPALRGLGVFALGLVIAQGGLGAITVYYKLPWAVSTAHLLTGFSYLALLLYLAFETRPAAPPLGLALRGPLGKTRRWVLFALGVVFLQILIGGLVRHHEASLASLSLPLHNGQLWPADAAFAVKLQMAHRLFGVFAALVTIAASVAVFRAARGWPSVRRLAVLAPIVVLGQVALGVAVIATLRAVPVAVLHFAGASLLWAIWVGLALLTRDERAACARQPALGALAEGALT